MAPSPCSKITYGSEALAKCVLQERIEAGGDEKNAYQCPDCKKWHLTSMVSEPDGIIVHEEIVSFLQKGRHIVVATGRWSDGRLANVQISEDFEGEHTVIRIHRANVGALRSALKFILSAEDSEEAKA